MRLLVLGGTRFVGRAVVDSAVSVYADQSIPAVEGAAVPFRRHVRRS